MCIQRKVGGDTMNKTRPNRVYCRVTDEELEEIKQCVETSGMTRQDWLLCAVKAFIKGGDTSQKEVVTPSTDVKPNTKLCPECGAAMQIKMAVVANSGVVRTTLDVIIQEIGMVINYAYCIDCQGAWLFKSQRQIH